MSGRWILTSMIIGSVAMAAVFYTVLRKAPEYKQLVTQEMHTEFDQYIQSTQSSDRLKVVEHETGVYFVSFKTPWKFELQDTKWLVTVPEPVSEAGQSPPPDLVSAAQKSVSDLVWAWLDQKYSGDRKKLDLEVQFQPSTQPKSQ
jgi:hypothetical protein